MIERNGLVNKMISSKYKEAVIDNNALNSVAKFIYEDCMNAFFYNAVKPSFYFHDAECKNPYTKEAYGRSFLKPNTIQVFSNPEDPYFVIDTVIYISIANSISNFSLPDLDQIILSDKSTGIKLSDKFANACPVTLFIKQRDFYNSASFLTFNLLKILEH